MVELKNKYPFPGSEWLCQAKPHFAATCWAILSRNQKVNLYCVKALFWVFLPKQIQLYMIKSVRWPLRIMELKQNWRESKPRVCLRGASWSQCNTNTFQLQLHTSHLLKENAPPKICFQTLGPHLSKWQSKFFQKKDECFLRGESNFQFPSGKMETKRVQAICSPSLIYLIIRREPSQAGSIVHF